MALPPPQNGDRNSGHKHGARFTDSAEHAPDLNVVPDDRSGEPSVCPACGSALRFREAQAARDYVTGDAFSVVRCSSCDVAWTHPRPEDMDRYYPPRYRRYVPVVTATLSLLYLWRVSNWSRACGKPGKALEIGCGDGVMLNALRARGWQVCGTERTAEMAAIARERYGIQVYVPPDGPVAGRDAFDLVILFQVLEHLPDPVATLHEARGFLTPHGRIVVGVPNLSSWQSRFGRDGWLHLDVPRHLVHFNPASLAATANRAGLRVERIRFVSPEHDPYGWIQTLLNRWCSNRNRLTLLLMGMAPWRFQDLSTLCAVAFLGPLACLLAVVSWACGAGAIMEAVLVRDE